MSVINFYDENICQQSVVIVVEDYEIIANASILRNRSEYIKNALEIDPKKVSFVAAPVTWYQLATFTRKCYALAGFPPDDKHFDIEDECFRHFGGLDVDKELEFMTMYVDDKAFEYHAKFLSFMGAGKDVWDQYDLTLQQVYEEKNGCIEYSNIFVLDRYRENIPTTLKYFTMCLASTMLKDPTFRQRFFSRYRHELSNMSSKTWTRLMNLYFKGESEALDRWDTPLEKASFENVQYQYEHAGKVLWSNRCS